MGAVSVHRRRPEVLRTAPFMKKIFNYGSSAIQARYHFFLRAAPFCGTRMAAVLNRYE